MEVCQVHSGVSSRIWAGMNACTFIVEVKRGWRMGNTFAVGNYLSVMSFWLFTYSVFYCVGDDDQSWGLSGEGKLYNNNIVINSNQNPKESSFTSSSTVRILYTTHKASSKESGVGAGKDLKCQGELTVLHDKKHKWVKLCSCAVNLQKAVEEAVYPGMYT